MRGNKTLRVVQTIDNFLDSLITPCDWMRQQGAAPPKKYFVSAFDISKLVMMANNIIM